MEWLTLAFMQRALLAALITGVTAPAIGTFLVQRRLSLLGDGLGSPRRCRRRPGLAHRHRPAADGRR